ncbi:Cof-type HAD-IIB family hydrolase [Dermatophilus congolensis]|uniref:Putative hydrolase M6_Spy0533 n=1 Tax=Dermatophilus congolensis TaxID=1863 RepID=A0A239V6Z2_9MICO|nr:Cof-type HAD-IIB family hydrolase [Dermatophilus congolensis]SNV17253.1 Putative hydrolase M6_Spy0533 [Dermatophilus congolensis]
MNTYQPTHQQPCTLPAQLPLPAGSHLIALDIDGTTIGHDGTLTNRVRDAIQRSNTNGHHIIIATGRSILSAAPIITALGLQRGYAVTSNGAVTLRLDPDLPHGWEIIDQRTFDPAPILHTLRREFPTGALAVERVGVGFDIHGDFPRSELDGQIHTVAWEDLFTHPTTRVTFNDPEADVEHFTDRIGKMGLHGVNYAIGFTAWLDITATGVSKASALENIRTHLGIDPTHTLAVGDQRNDIEMLTWAACGIAMGNAPDEVAAIADYVTAHVDNDGLADVLDLLPNA